ncbi:MAG: tRNA (N(6)-L-threonylcarbamoyladenosine(37)-C(2))-methylthiotransferase MtaB [Thermodesulfobacteriota bacterium]
MTIPTASVQTLGCKVNQFESAALGRMLVEAGFLLVPKDRPADLTVINTCTVTHRADFEVRNLARRAHRANPAGRTVITGCLAQLRPEEMAGLPGVVLVAGQDKKGEILRLLEGLREPALVVPPPGASGVILDLGFPAFDRTRTFFRVQDGCGAGCSYCTVPAARGPSRSLPLERVLAGLEHYAGQGYAEVVLTGIHLGAWGLDLAPGLDLAYLLDRVTEDENGPRLRLSSVEPNEVGEDIQHLLGSRTRICPHLHLPLQSGSDRILRAMCRPYTARTFRELVLNLHAIREDLCFGADVMAGFPGEKDEDFTRTIELVSALPLAYLHVFPFSRRPGTPAAAMSGQVPEPVKKRRVSQLRELGGRKRIEFFHRFLGRVRPALVENSPDRATGLARGLTDNYLRVLIAPPAPPPGTTALVRLERIGPDGRVYGRTA